MVVRSVRKRLDAERRSLCRDGEIIEVLPGVTRLRPQDGAYHCVIYSALSRDTADAAIAGQILHYRALAAGFEWKVYSHDRPPDLLQRLERHGFTVGAREAVLALDASDTPDWAAGAGGAEVVRVERPEQVRLFRDAAEEIFGKDYGLTADHRRRAAHQPPDAGASRVSPRCRHLAVRVGGGRLSRGRRIGRFERGG